jgi:hypothetical protein
MAISAELVIMLLEAGIENGAKYINNIKKSKQVVLTEDILEELLKLEDFTSGSKRAQQDKLNGRK